MAKTFNGTTDIITAAVAAITGSWTMGAWVFPTGAGENNAGRILSVESGTTVRQDLAFGSAGRPIRSTQTATVSALTLTSTTVPTGVWSLVLASFRLSDFTIRVFIGSLSTPMTEAAYTTVTVGSGSPGTAGTNCRIGNNGLSSQTWAGRLAGAVLSAREWSLDEMETYRLGRRPVTSGSLRGYWPLDSPTAAQCEDLSGNGANGAVTGTTVSEGPPVPSAWVGVG